MRLIDADTLKNEVNKKNVVGRFNTIMLIDNAPTIVKCDKTSDGLPLMDLRPRPQGEWKIGGKTTHYHYCSICGKDGDFQDNFCRNCGADMRGGAE